MTIPAGTIVCPVCQNIDDGGLTCSHCQGRGWLPGPPRFAQDDPDYVWGLNQLASRIAFHNEGQGWTIDTANVDRKLLLAVSEICEAQNELRDGRTCDEVYWRGAGGETTGPVGSIENGDKPEGFPVEIADAMIRLLHICNAFHIDIAAVIALKLKYNRLRPIKAGRIF